MLQSPVTRTQNWEASKAPAKFSTCHFLSGHKAASSAPRTTQCHLHSVGQSNNMKGMLYHNSKCQECGSDWPTSIQGPKHGLGCHEDGHSLHKLSSQCPRLQRLGLAITAGREHPGKNTLSLQSTNTEQTHAMLLYKPNDFEIYSLGSVFGGSCT